MNLKLGELEKSAERLPEKQVVTYERTAPKERPTPAETFAHLPVVETIEIIPDEVKANPEALRADRRGTHLRGGYPSAEARETGDREAEVPA